MGHPELWQIFIENEIEDLSAVILAIGIHGLMGEFDDWLRRHQCIDAKYEQIMQQEHSQK